MLVIRPARNIRVKLSIIIPCYNEEKNLDVLHTRLTEVVSRCTDDYELICVNDGSRDRTLEGLQALAAKDRHVKFLSFSRNFGHETAVAAGLDRAGASWEGGCDAAVLIDADLQDPPELIAQMVARWKQGVQVIYAKRRKRRGDPVFKKIAIYFFYRLMGKISEIDIPLDTGNYRLMDRRVVEVVRACRENPRYVRGLVPWAGFKQEALEFDRDPRHAGETGYGFFKLAKLALDGICSFSQAPLRLATYLGSIVMGLSVFLAIVVVLERIFFNSEEIPRGFAFLACATFFMGGVQLFMLGMLAQYVGYIFKNVQNRPMYIIADEGGFPAPGPIVGPTPSAHGFAAQVVVRTGDLGALNGRALTPPPALTTRGAEPPRG